MGEQGEKSLFERVAAGLAGKKDADAVSKMLSVAMELRGGGLEKHAIFDHIKRSARPEYQRLVGVLRDADELSSSIIASAIRLERQGCPRRVASFAVAAAVSQKMRRGTGYDMRDVGCVLRDMGDPRAAGVEGQAAGLGIVAASDDRMRVRAAVYDAVARVLPPRVVLVSIWGWRAELEDRVVSYLRGAGEATAAELEGEFGAGEALDEVLDALKNVGFIISPKVGVYRVVG